MHPFQHTRRILFPVLDRVVPDSIHPYFVSRMHPDEYVGIVRERPTVVRERLTEMGDVYLGVAAAQRVLRPDTRLAGQTDVALNGDPVLTCGSFAVRPDGRFGEWQTHIRLVATSDGATAVFAHRERNPLSYPRRHLAADGFTFQTGHDVAHTRLSITEVPLANLTLQNESMSTDTDNTTDTKPYKRTAAKKQAVLGIVVTLAPIAATKLVDGLTFSGGVGVTDMTTFVQGLLGTVAVAILLGARYVYEIEQVPEEITVGVILRVTGRLAKLLAR